MPIEMKFEIEDGRPDEKTGVMLALLRRNVHAWCFEVFWGDECRG